jgi:transposase-like protein
VKDDVHVPPSQYWGFNAPVVDRAAEHAKHFILALCEAFQKDLIVVRDGAPYFRASALTDLAARDDLEVVRLPAYSPELNPVEECWRQVKRDLSTRFFGSLEELTTAIDDALDQLSIPDVSNYF